MTESGSRLKTQVIGKGVPWYIMGNVGWVQRVRGPISNLRDHRDARSPITLAAFSLSQSFRMGSENEKIFVAVFEDWMIAD